MKFELHSYNTPNGQKVIIALEEVGVDYQYHSVNITRAEQHTPEFRAISPDGKIPALVTSPEVDGGETTPIVHFESGAILMHLASIFPQLHAQSERERALVLSWTFWQVGQLGPMAGQFGQFSRADVPNPAAVEHFKQLVWRCLDVMENRLSASTYLAGNCFTVADIACLPWIASDVSYLQKYDFKWRDKHPAVVRWVDTLMQRPSVKKALE